MTSTLKQAWKNEYFRTAVMIVAIAVIVLGFWFGSQTALGTQYPALAVASGSMCEAQHMACDGWSHPFARTLHVGDLIIIQGIDPKAIKAAPEPDGDIIVFHSGDELIVHRAIAERTDANGKIHFTAKGDGNQYPGPAEVPEENVVGKVIVRIPWVGRLALFMRGSSAIYVILVIIIVMVILEFVVPASKPKETEIEPNTNVDFASPT